MRKTPNEISGNDCSDNAEKPPVKVKPILLYQSNGGLCFRLFIQFFKVCPTGWFDLHINEITNLPDRISPQIGC